MSAPESILGPLYHTACRLDDASQVYDADRPVYRLVVAAKAAVILARHFPDGTAWQVAAREAAAYGAGLDLSPWPEDGARPYIGRMAREIIAGLGSLCSLVGGVTQ